MDRIRLEEGDLIIDEDIPTEESHLPEEIDDEYEARAENWFHHFRNREKILGEKYPFTLEKDQLVSNMPENLNPVQKIYVYLLFCSHLKFFKDYQPILTSDFEHLSLLAIKALLPTRAKIISVGKRIDSVQTGMRGNVFSKIQKIAGELKEKILVSETDFPSRSSGDGGLDIIAYIPFSDNKNSLIVYAGQCKCSLEWINAKNPALVLESFMTCNHKPINLFFIPFLFRKRNFDWHENQNVKSKILIDRLRLIDLVNFSTFSPDSLSSIEKINNLLVETEPTV